MRDVLPFIAVLACPVGMGLCMWLMARGRRNDRPAAEPSLDELRAEHRRVTADLEAAEKRELSGVADQSTERS
jgi:hypothetical protein